MEMPPSPPAQPTRGHRIEAYYKPLAGSVSWVTGPETSFSRYTPPELESWTEPVTGRIVFSLWAKEGEVVKGKLKIQRAIRDWHLDAAVADIDGFI